MKPIETARALLERCINDRPLRKITFSAPHEKTNPFFKVTVQPIRDKKDGVFYQFAFYYETKVRHENYTDTADVCARLGQLITDGYKQCDVMLFGETLTIRMNKNQQCTLITPKKKRLKAPAEAPPEEPPAHNAARHYILKEQTRIPWLTALGIMDNEGRVIPKQYKKFRQLNNFLEMVRGVAGQIPRDATIIDVGCGKSYLTFALYYYLNEIEHKNVTITGLDRKPDVVLTCQRLAELFGFTQLQFICSDIETYRCDKPAVDMVITLHACDTATDYALYSAVSWGAALILSVPCCQHELFNQLQNEALQPLLKHGILKERFAALLTDALRAALLESAGYRCAVVEFIDMAHTPKNIMIRAVKKTGGAVRPALSPDYRRLASSFSVHPKLETLLIEAGLLTQ